MDLGPEDVGVEHSEFAHPSDPPFFAKEKGGRVTDSGGFEGHSSLSPRIVRHAGLFLRFRWPAIRSFRGGESEEWSGWRDSNPRFVVQFPSFNRFFANVL